VSDAAFVANARKSWDRTLALQDKPDFDNSGLSVAVALWATLNVDQLLKIAERAAMQESTQMRHVAYFDEGEFHWLSGHAPRDCELFAAIPERSKSSSHGGEK